MDLLRGTFSISRFSEDDPPHITNLSKKTYPLLKRKLFEGESESEDLIQVCLRIKPSKGPNHLYEIRDEQSLITYGDTTTAGHGRRTQNNVSKLYKFSHIFSPESSQREIFNLLVKDNLQKLADGQSYTLLTYGASGSGKTYTLLGTEDQPGLIPRSLEYIFKIVDTSQHPTYKPVDGKSKKLSADEQHREMQKVSKLRQISAPVREKYKRMSMRASSEFTQSTFDLTNNTRYYVWVSFVEIYNENIYDLLVPSEKKATTKLHIREDTNRHIYVKGAQQAFVRSGAEAYDVMAAGRHNLQVAATGVHATSSRSHCIFTITMLADTPEGVVTSCVRLCDLAGSERAKSTHNTGARMAESRAINTSLHILERCLHARRQNQHGGRVPYRESKLTRLLGAGLSGGEPVTMLVTVNPSPQYIHETRHVLQLAAVARDIQINNTIYESSSTMNSTDDLSTISNEELMKLRAENERLQFELMQVIENNKELQNQIEEERASHAAACKDIVKEIKDMSKQFYEAHISSLTQQHKAEMDELLKELEHAKNNQFQNNKKPILEVVIQLENNMKKENFVEVKKLVRELKNLVNCKEDDDVHFINTEENNLSKSYVSDNYDESRSYIRETYSSVRNSSVRRSSSIIDNNESRLMTETLEINYDKKIDELVEVKLEQTFEIGSSQKRNSNQILLLADEDSCSSSTEDLSVHNESENECNVIDVTLSPNKVNEISRNSNVNVLSDDDDDCLISNPKKQSDGLTSDSKKQGDLDLNTVENKLSKISEENTIEKSKNLTNDANVTNLSVRDSKDGSLMLFENAEKAVDDEMCKRNDDANLTYNNTSSMRDSNLENGSLMSFENVEDAVNKEVALEEKQTQNRSSFFKFTKKDTSYFRNLNEKVLNNTLNIKAEPITPKSNSRSPSINNDDTPIVHCNTVIKKMLPVKEHSIDVFDDVVSPTQENNTKTTENYTKHEQIDNLNKSNEKLTQISDNKNSDNLNKSMEKLTLVSDYKKSKKYFSLSDDSGVTENRNSTESCSKTESDISGMSLIKSITTDQENTLEKFDNIYQDLSNSNLTQFDLLIKSEYFDNGKTLNNQTNKSIDVENKSQNKEEKCKIETTEKDVLLNKTSSFEEEKKTKRALRPRRCKNIQSDEGNDNKMKNLQKEFSDVTLDKPVENKIVPDIPSPEVCSGDQENVPPLQLMSCPSKSILRSRRKLFTPRAEPLDQSPDSGGRPRVPRPSYCRARRRLQ